MSGGFASLNQWGNQMVGMPGTDGSPMQQSMWNAQYGPGGFNTFVSGGSGMNGSRFDVNAAPNDQGKVFMASQTLTSGAEKNMDAVTKAKFEAGSFKLPQSDAQAIADAYLRQGNNASDVISQKAASSFVSQYGDSSSSSNSLINPMYSSGSSNVMSFHAATGMDIMVPGSGPPDSVRVQGMVSPGERMIVVPPGGSLPGQNSQAPTVGRAWQRGGDSADHQHHSGEHARRVRHHVATRGTGGTGRSRGFQASLMALNVDATRLPDYIERGARGGPKFDTTINSALSGVEQRVANRVLSRGEWQIGYGLRTAGDWKPVLALHYAQRGSLYGFTFRDWSDYCVTDGSIGTGDGANKVFPLVKVYDVGVRQYVRAITLPDTTTLVVNVSGTPTTAFTITDLATGWVSLMYSNSL